MAAEAPLHRGLPDEIVVWEILLRLPPKTLLRCRAVCSAWRRATSVRGFLLAHHARQPSVPLLCCNEYNVDQANVDCIHIIPFDHHRAGAAADQLQSVARLGNSLSGDFGILASCDGILVLSDRIRNLGFSVCNPATRQHAPLPQLDGFMLMGMYLHSPTSEYRLLLGKWSVSPDNDQDGCYVFTLGSGQPPRRIRTCLYHAEEQLLQMYGAFPVLFRGSLHGHLPKHERASTVILVFDTIAETFRRMRALAVPGCCDDLFVMADTLAMSSFHDDRTIIDIWVMQDYESQAWAFKYRVELPVAELTAQFGKFYGGWSMLVPSWDGAHVSVLVQLDDGLFQVDINGKVVASFHRRGLSPTLFWLKQTLVSHEFFPALEGYVVNASPFI